MTFEAIRVSSFDFSHPRAATSGDIIYRSTASKLAEHVIAHLVVPGVHMFETPPPARRIDPAVAVQSMLCHGRDRGTIRRTVTSVGGLPVVVQVAGGEGGVGTMICESWPSLFSLLDYLAATGITPTLSHFIENARHWRCITLGSAVVASYLNEPLDDDFRTVPPSERSAYTADAPAGVCEAALKAVSSLGVEFAGVDVLVGNDLVPLVAEVNAPCNFSPAQTIGAIAISDMLVDYLAARPRA